MRGWLVIILGISCILLIALMFLVLFLNRGSESIKPVIFKVIGFILAALVFLSIDILKAPEEMHTKANFLILRNNNAELLNLVPVTAAINVSQWHAYSLLDQTWIMGYTPQSDTFIKDQHTEEEHVFDELVAATFLKWMAYHYSIHWEMEHNYIDGISGGGGHSSQKKNRDNKTATYYFKDSPNGFLRSDQPFNRIRVPKGSQASLSTTILESVFTIKNRKMVFTFKSIRLGNSGVSHSILGKKIDARLENPGSFFAHDYIITLDATFSRFLRWSPQTLKQKEWITQIFENFERDFSWDLFKVQFEKALNELPKDTKLQGIPLSIKDEDRDGGYMGTGK